MKLSKFTKTPLNVALRKTQVENPLFPRVILASKKERLLFCSKLNVNFKFLCLPFIYLVNNKRRSLDLNKTNMSSTYHLYITSLNSGGQLSGQSFS